ncbi:Npun_R1517 family heterocyst differentiation transcriptional regulator [Okeania sp. SIO1F9]|uniref:Npun_R1517 family heterocyst differentiation transcriptional regulator n=1 Tax=Okeania sp. SIO1F9 TaxID=2607813 RepID=UPI002579A24F|nr:Npun_R1517 family heterocyst differentiation transcriptional regulator [Okeania sp. SIO1F9]
MGDRHAEIVKARTTQKYRREKVAMDGRDRGALLESLVDAYTYGNDEYFESLDSHVDVQEVEALEASPAMRRQLIRLRNSDRWD